MKIGLIGLPNSGKTTIFNALTKSKAEVTEYASKKAEPNIAVVNVIDDRVNYLSAMYKPKKLYMQLLNSLILSCLLKSLKNLIYFQALQWL